MEGEEKNEEPLKMEKKSEKVLFWLNREREEEKGRKTGEKEQESKRN